MVISFQSEIAHEKNGKAMAGVDPKAAAVRTVCEQFCHRRGISAAYFSQIKRKYSVQKPDLISPDTGFIKLPTDSLNQQNYLTAGVQLEFRGARITVPEHYSPVWVADLLKALML